MQPHSGVGACTPRPMKLRAAAAVMLALYCAVAAAVAGKTGSLTVLLSDGDGEADGLMDLADLSLRKILRLKKEGKLLGDISRGCSGASSVITKKVLLMKAAQEDFRIALSPAQSASIQTLEDLAAAILEQRKT